MNTKKLWLGFILVTVISFSVLLYFGREIYHQAPPIPDAVVTADGHLLFNGQFIKDGQSKFNITNAPRPTPFLQKEFGKMVLFISIFAFF